MSPDRLDPKELASIRLDAMRQRARRIRCSVTGLALALFTAAFVAVYVQLASGHDPALSASTAKRQTTSTAVAAQTTSSESTSAKAAESEESTGESSASGGSEETTESPSAVTSRQS